MTCHLKHETAGPHASCGHRHKYGGNQQSHPLSIPYPAALRRLGASENNRAEPLISLMRKLGSSQWRLRGHPRVWILCFWKSETRLSTINTGTKKSAANTTGRIVNSPLRVAKSRARRLDQWGPGCSGVLSVSVPIQPSALPSSFIGREVRIKGRSIA